MKIELNCAECGRNRFNYPLVLTGDSVITCTDCGHVIGTLAELQDKVVHELGLRRSGERN